MLRTLILSAATAVLATAAVNANAANVITYYNFDTLNGGGDIEDQVGSADITNVAGTLDTDSPLGDTLGSSLASSTGITSVPQADAPSFGTGDFSVSFWFNHVDGNTAGIIDSLASGDGGLQLNFGTNALNNRLAVGIRDTGGGFQVVSSEALTGFGNWIHMAVTVDRDSATGVVFYVNGVAQGTLGDATVWSGAAVDATQDMQIGGFNGNNAGRATDNIDELAFYTGILTPTEVAGLANGTLSPTQIPEPGSLALIGLGSLCVLRRRC